jgi:fumarate hydratase subunit beta
MGDVELTTPILKKDIEQLSVGDSVYITGKIYTARDEAHLRALSYYEKEKALPEDWTRAVIFHCGPLVAKRDKRWELVAAGPTTSSRMNSLEPRIIDIFDIAAVIGKGGMDTGTLAAMKKNKTCYLSQTGGCAVLAADRITIEDVHWFDLGMPEAMWVFRCDRFGPLIVGMDCHGKSIYEDVGKKVKENLKKLKK